MRTLFVLGNGFDINLGLRTSYQDFYDYYLKQPSEDADILALKDHLKGERYKTWADLELGLGAYTAQVAGFEQLRTVYCDLSDRLREYLGKEVGNLSVTDNVKQAIVSGLISPESCLPQGIHQGMKSFRNGTYPEYMNVISFNYTDSLERILKGVKIINDVYQVGPKTYLESIEHIHMRLEDEDVIMGVNDDSQIAGKDYLDDNLRALLVKPYINLQLQSLVDSRCIQLINNADLICLYGVSLGETDMMWWRAIGERFRKANIRVLYFVYGKENITRNFDRISRYIECRSLLFERMGIPNPTDEQLNRVYIGYKTKLFKVN